jgi:hypothetical protein
LFPTSSKESPNTKLAGTSDLTHVTKERLIKIKNTIIGLKWIMSVKEAIIKYNMSKFLRVEKRCKNRGMQRGN